MFFDNARSLFALITCSMVVLFLDFYEAILSIHLLKVYGLGAEYNGYVFAVPCLTYCLITPFVSRLSETFSSKRQLIFCSFVLCFISLLLSGPSEALGLDNNLWVLLFGLGLNGVASGCAFIPIFPEIMEAVMEQHGIEDETDELCDKVSGIYGTFYSIGSVVAPILGGALGDSIGYRSTCDVVALATFIFCIFFAFFNLGLKAPKGHKRQKVMEVLLIED